MLMNLKKIFALTIILISGIAQSSVVISGTRVIYPANSRDVNVHLNNAGEFPSLIQTWVDNGDPKAKPENIDVPFLLSPPIFRIDPGKGQNLRLVYTGDELPGDRESVFWLNVLEIPPKPGEEIGENYLQFAVRSRLKIFFRPLNLKGDPSKAAAAVTWKLSSDNNNWIIRAQNPTPFHVSMAEVKLQARGQDLGAGMLGMIPPFSELPFNFEANPNAETAIPDSVFYKYIDDYGAMNEGSFPIEGFSSSIISNDTTTK
jgi:chaperone protein EcpD